MGDIESSKQCTQCKMVLLFEEFKVNKGNGQYTKMCIKCLDQAKKSRDKNKCQHGKRRYQCRDPTCSGGGAFCMHNIQRSTCRDSECRGGNAFCKHNIARSRCRDSECGGGNAFCMHNIARAICRDPTCDGGTTFCMHSIQRSTFRNSTFEGGGTKYCKHNIAKSRCRDPECSGGGAFCRHNKRKDCFKICNPIGHLASIVRNRIYQALKHNKKLHSTDYTKCTTEEFKQHIEGQFKDGMTWCNYGSEWHVDHRIPLAYKEDGKIPTLEEVIERCHYFNTQPLWASENRLKGNRYIS